MSVGRASSPSRWVYVLVGLLCFLCLKQRTSAAASQPTPARHKHASPPTRHEYDGATALDNLLHSIHRVDYKFHEVPSSPPPSFWKNTPYLHGVTMAVGVMVIIFLLFFVVDCCQRSRRCLVESCHDANMKEGHDDDDLQFVTPIPRRRCGLMLLSLMLAVICVAGAYYVNNDGMDGSLRHIHTQLEDLYTYYEEIRQTARDIDNIQAGVNLVNYVLTGGFPLVPSARAEAEELLSRLLQGQDQVNRYLNVTSSLDIQKVLNSYNSGREQFVADSTLLLAASVVALLLVCFTAWYIHKHVLRLGSRCVLASLDVVVMAVVAAMWLAVSAELAAAIVTADVCQDPNTFVVNQTDVLLSGSVEKDAVHFYVKCDDLVSSGPFGTSVQQAQGYIQSSYSYLDDLYTFAVQADNSTLMMLVNNTRDNITVADHALGSLLTLLQCVRPHNILVHIENTLCDEVVADVIVLLVLEGIVVWSIVMGRCMMDCPPPPCNKRKRKGYEELDDDDFDDNGDPVDFERLHYQAGVPRAGVGGAGGVGGHGHNPGLIDPEEELFDAPPPARGPFRGVRPAAVVYEPAAPIPVPHPALAREPSAPPGGLLLDAGAPVAYGALGVSPAEARQAGAYDLPPAFVDEPVLADVPLNTSD